MSEQVTMDRAVRPARLVGPPRLDEAQRVAFQRDGVIKVPGALPSAAVEAMIAAVDRWQASPEATGAFGLDRHLYPRDDAFRSFVFDLGLAELAASAMLSERVRIYFDQIFVKQGGTDDSVFHWHQDRPFWPIDGTQVCSTWVALTEASVAASALEFVKGSHRWDKQYRPYVGDGLSAEEMNRIWPHFGDHAMSIEHEIEAFESHPDRYDVGGFDVEPGDVLLFDYRILHRSRGNASPHRRVAVSYRWLGDDARWAPVPGADPVIGPEHTTMQPGQLIDDDAVFPVAFGPGAPLSLVDRPAAAPTPS